VHAPFPLRVLSYNIQTGISTRRYRHYLTRSWTHVLPHPERAVNLDGIAAIMAGFDLVGIQEADAGSLRSEFTNQIEYLALRAGFPHWYHHVNRRLGRLAQHSLGLLSRWPVLGAAGHKLPGRIPGRSALVARVATPGGDVLVIIIHLALGRPSRLRQIDYVADLVQDDRHVILLGDFNFRSESREMGFLMEKTGLQEPRHGLFTFPSWNPQVNIDHILVSPSFRVGSVEVLYHHYSDHLPLAANLTIPPARPRHPPDRGR
jgi:endonuclease/exonuclease/phosphatase family metal-dependent hydrolase